MPLVELRCPIAKRKNLKSYYPPSGFETKILFSSRDTDSELKYDPTSVHGMFVHSFSLDLQNVNIKIEMKTYLETKTMSDESYSRNQISVSVTRWSDHRNLVHS